MNNHELKANPEMVRKITDHLVAAYEQFLDDNEDVAYLDGFMAAHNFHCAIIFHMEREGEFDAKSAQYFRRMAKDTFEKRMRDEALP